MQDPLPPLGAPRQKDSGNFYSGSLTASLVYRPLEPLSLYVTAQRIHALNGSLAGGGLLLNNGVLEKDEFRNRSDLLEVGVRVDLFENRAFTGLSAFWQERERTEFRGGESDIIVRGLEQEFTWQITPNLFFWENAAYTEGNFDDSAPFQAGGRSLFDGFAAGTGPGGQGTGLGPNIFNQVPPGDYRIPGLSRWIVNLGLSYRPRRGLGGSLWWTWQSSQNGNLDNEYTIPAQHTLNAELLWRSEGWEVGFSLLNVTDERNFTHSGDNFLNNVLLFQEAPRRGEVFFRLWL